MNKFTDSLDNVKVASPCPANWNGMIGNDRERYCSAWALHKNALFAEARTK